MTDQHPLTDEICEDLSSCITILTAPGDPDPYICPQYVAKYVADDMRAAYDKGRDDQLERVIEWLKDNVSHSLALEVADKVVLRLDLDWITDDLSRQCAPQKHRRPTDD